MTDDLFDFGTSSTPLPVSVPPVLPRPAPVVTTTTVPVVPVPVEPAPPPGPSAAERFREARTKMLEWERKAEAKQPVDLKAVQELTRLMAALIHEMQTSTTGPKKAKDPSAPRAKQPVSKKKVSLAQLAIPEGDDF